MTAWIYIAECPSCSFPNTSFKNKCHLNKTPIFCLMLLEQNKRASGDVIFSMRSTGRLQASLIYMLDLVTVERKELSYCDSQRKLLNGKIACVFNTLRAVMQNWMATASMLLLIYQKNTAGSDIIGQNLTSFIFWSARKNKSYSRHYLHELWTV